MIRPVETRDAAAVVAIHNHYVLHTLITFDTEPMSEEAMRGRIEGALAAGNPWLVAEIDGRVAGYCYAHPWKGRTGNGRTLESSIYLAPEATGRGVGRALMEALIDACRSREVHALVACVVEGNAASDALHRRMGFRPVGRCREVGCKDDRWLDVDDYLLHL